MSKTYPNNKVKSRAERITQSNHLAQKWGGVKTPKDSFERLRQANLATHMRGFNNLFKPSIM